MLKGRKPSRITKLNIWGGEKLPCPLGVLRDTKDTRECMQIKNISNTVTFDYKYKSRFSHPYFHFAFLFPDTEHVLPVLASFLPATLRNQSKATQAAVDPNYPSWQQGQEVQTSTCSSALPLQMYAEAVGLPSSAA